MKNNSKKIENKSQNQLLPFLTDLLVKKQDKQEAMQNQELTEKIKQPNQKIIVYEAEIELLNKIIKKVKSIK